jgi:parallel beta-helix repeat protein
MKTKHLFISFILGLGLALALLWIMGIGCRSVTAAPYLEVDNDPPTAYHLTISPTFKGGTCTSIYTITNQGAVDVHTAHDFYDMDDQLLGTINDTIAMGAWKAYDLGTLGIFGYFTGYVIVSADQPITYTLDICPGQNHTCQARINDHPADYTTVQAAIDAASDGDVVKVARYCTDVSTRAGVTQTAYIDKSITLRGGYTTTNWTTPDPDANPTTLDAQGQGRVIYITGGISPTVEGLEITGGNRGGVYIETAAATLQNCRIFGNTGVFGGGVYMSHSDSKLFENTFESNTATDSGGGLFIQFGDSAVISGNIFISNSANASYGGGVYLNNSDSTLINNTFISNTVSSYGGGMFLYESDATLTGNTVFSNTANNGGGGLGLMYSDATLDGNTVASNTASFGGGVFVYRGIPTLSDNTITANTATQSGGRFFVNNSTVTLSGNTITSNTATNSGGGLYMQNSDAAIGGNTVTANTASQGGGLYLTNSPATITGNTIISNTAGWGGGLRLDYSAATLSGNTIASNTAEEAGGGVYLYYSAATLSENTIISNTAGIWGGGLRLYGSAATLSGNTIISNTSQWGGGLLLSFGTPTLSGNTIISNIASSGGGMYLYYTTATLSNNTISGNTAEHNGGGLCFEEDDATLSNNNIASNTANDGGGGLFLYDSDATLNGNIVTSNTADSGGGLTLSSSDATLTNNVVAGNQANNASSGLYVWGSSPYLLHTTIARNTGGDGSGVYVGGDHEEGYSTFALTNTILVSHSVGISVTGGNTVTVNGILWDSSTPITVSQATTAVVTVQNQRTGDPAFAADGYHITPASDTIDAGVDTGVILDMDGEARPFDAGPDLGADEWATAETTVEPASAATLTATVGGLTTTVAVPSQAVTEAVTLKYTALAVTAHGSPANFAFADQAFDLDAYQGETLRAGFVFSKPVTITIHYDEGDIGGVNEDTLVLEYWDEGTSGWVDAVATCIPASVYDRHPDEDWLALPICHLSRFALFGEGQRDVYLPLVLCDY